MTNREKLQGFTLVELLVVIALIGILAAIALVVIDPVQMQKRARDGVLKAQIDKIGMAASGVSATDDNQYFPTCFVLDASLKNAAPGANCIAVPAAGTPQRFAMTVGSLGSVTFNYFNTNGATPPNACAAAQGYVDTAKYWQWCSSTGAITEVTGAFSATVGCTAGC